MTNDIPVDDCAFREDFEQLGQAIVRVNGIKSDFELGSFEPTIHDVTLRFAQPVIWAKVLMENIGGPRTDCEDMDEDEKLFWTKVTFEMGPDWIAKFRRIGAFMAAIDKA